MRRRLRGTAALAVVGLLGLAGCASAAHAGEWEQISCVNPNGTAASSQGWTGSATGSPPLGSTTNTECGPGTPLSAGLLSAFGPAPGGSGESLEYTPPAGSTLAGGVLQISLSSDSNGPNLDAVSEVDVYSPAQTLDDRLISCTPYVSACPTGTTDSYTTYAGPLTLPSQEGGNVIVVAQCDGSGTSCDENGSGGYWAYAAVSSADLLLSSDESPGGAGFSGSALQGAVRGTAHLVFTATDPGGPGVYSVTVGLDGRTAWSGQPDTNDGACVAVGTDAGTGALEFDSAQPCLTSETVDVPVPTAGLPDGQHRLTVAVTDAAGNTSTVLDRGITTFNPQATPLPAYGLKARFVIGSRWAGSRTRLDGVTVSALPRDGRVSVACRGARCPRLAHRSEPARQVTRLLRALDGATLRAGDRLLITVSAPHRRAERIELLIRRGREPSARLLGAGRRSRR